MTLWVTHISNHHYKTEKKFQVILYSCFSIAVIKYHNRGNLRMIEFILTIVPEGEKPDHNKTQQQVADLLTGT